jgi:alanine racemase
VTGSSCTTAIIDLSALGHNLTQVRRRIPQTCDLLAIVKADAYGHGAGPIARTLGRLGVTRLGVATLDEGAALREAGLSGSILVMGALFPAHISDLIGYQLTPVIYDPDFLEAFARAVPPRPTPYPVHLKVDTGMARLGFEPEAVLPVLQSPPFKGTLQAEGLMTHLADADGEDPAYTDTQVARLQTIVQAIRAAGLPVPLAHAANSAAILCHPQAHLDLVRPGLMLYGYHTVSAPSPSPDLKPVLTLTTKVLQVRTLRHGQSVSYNRTFVTRRASRVAILAVGYADGYRRALSNRAAVLLGGRRAPVVGQICMDMTLADVTELPEVKPGDTAVLLGRQGSHQISATDLASWADTIPYEILCGIGPRVRRVYERES